MFAPLVSIAVAIPETRQGRISPIGFAPMGDFHHQDRSSRIINCVDDPVFALPDPILLFCRQFFASRWTGITRELLNPLGDALTIVPEDIFKFLHGRRLNEDLIAVHAASGP